MVSCRWSRQGMSVVVERKAWWRRRRMALRVCGSGATTRPREFSLERALVAERASSQQQSPSWVNRVGLTICRRLPVLLRQRTSSGPVGMPQRCQLRTHAPQKSAAIRSPRGHWRATRATPLCDNPRSSASHFLIAGSERSTPIL